MKTSIQIAFCKEIINILEQKKITIKKCNEPSTSRTFKPWKVEKVCLKPLNMQELPITKVKETILKDLGKAEEKVKKCIGNCTQTELAFPVKAYFFSKSNRAIQRLKSLLFAFHNLGLNWYIGIVTKGLDNVHIAI